MHTETKVGFFVLSGIAVFAMTIILLGDLSFKRTYHAHVLFDSAEGLPVNGPIRVAGVEVGKIEQIDLENQRALVTLKMNKGVEVRRDAHARIASTGLIGSKYLSMTLGTPGAPRLGPDEVLQGDPAFTFDEVMMKLGEFFRDDPVNGSASENLKLSLVNLRKVTETLSAAVGDQKQDMVEIVRNVRDLSAHAKQVAADMADITSDRKEDIKVALAKIRSVSERLDDVLAKIQNGDGILGKLVGDKEMGQQLKQTMTSVQSAAKDAQFVMGHIARVEICWDYRQRYDFEDSRWRADMGLKFVPRPGQGKFYYLGGNNLGPRRDRRDPGNDIERRNTASALIGNEWGPFTGYAGIIRSQGGVGGLFRPIPKTDRFELKADAFNFSRDEWIQGIHMKGPIYNIGARAMVIRHPTVWVEGEVEDAAVRKNFNAGFHLNFKDDDIAYLLGLAGVAR